MELLYVWINQSKNEVFKQQGINFSPEFNFVVEKKNGKYALFEDSTWKRRPSVFQDDTIMNVSAIVGKNGVGKTTLLDYLSSLDCRPQFKENVKSGYEAMIERDIIEGLCIYVFREQKEICIYHNFEDGIVNETNYKEKNMSDKEVYRATLLQQSDINDVFKLYITNSGFGSIQKTGISRQIKLDEVALTPKGISTIASSYFTKLLDLNGFVHQNTLFYAWRSAIKPWLEIDRFQTICDVVYFNKIIKENRMESYSIRFSTRLSVSSVFAVALLREYSPKGINENQKKRLNEVKSFVEKLRYTKDENINLVIKNLISNLVFEMGLDSTEELSGEFCDVMDGLKWAKRKLKTTSNQMYFTEAINEIEVLNRILRGASVKANVVPQSDWAYDPSLILDYEIQPKVYTTFLEYVEERFSAKDSFVLRYLIMGNIGMSSGERAFQNFFSWMNLLPQFHKIDSSVPKEMRKNILLLIDEIDLYLHPKWQIDFILNLLDEVKIQFHEYKVQIIFTTHSPLCISDIPNENTIYLSMGENGVTVDDRRNHSQTFGKDVYSLLNDAFYLESNTMGAYVKKYIDNIIDQLIDKENNTYKTISFEEYEKLSELIQYIGNDILKDKLKAMLHKCYDSKKDELATLYKQQEKIRRRIAELEG